MKKLIPTLSILATIALAQTPDEVLIQALKPIAQGADIKVHSRHKLDNIPLDFVIIQDNTAGQMIPLYNSPDGKQFIGFNGLFELGSDNPKIQKALSIQSVDAINALPSSAFFMLPAKTKTDKVLAIVTDPECPYCQEDLKKFDERRATHNLKIIFAPVRGERATQKAALIMEEVAGQSPEKTMEIIKNYYNFDAVKKMPKKETVKTIEEARALLFGQGGIKGVPFTVEIK